MREVDKTVISQYSSSPVLCQLIDNLNAAISPDYDLEQFYDLLWNFNTAVGYGLDAWGRRVGIGRVLTIGSGEFFGFTGPSGHSGDSFNAGIFYSGEPITSNFALTDESYRQLILAKAAANITNGSVPAMNQMLLNLFPDRGNCYVQDNQNMTMEFVFEFPLYPFEVSIIVESGVFPVPTGVLATIVYPGLIQ